MQSSRSLIDIGNSYVNFLNKAGHADASYFKQEVPKLFAPRCKKIVNGSVKFETNDGFEKYMLTAQKSYGNWTIKVINPLYPSLEENAVTIKFMAETSKIQLLVIAILQINHEGLIEEIYELDTPIENSATHFKFESLNENNS